MTESYSVSARLNISTNAEQVLQHLIEQFEQFDKVVKDAQGKLGQFDKELSETGKGSAGWLAKAFADLKLPQSLLTDLNSIAAAGKAFATSSAEAAVAWKDIAAASKAIKGAPNPAAGGSQGGGTSGGGGRRGGGGGGGSNSGGGLSLWGNDDDLPNANWANRDVEARSKFQSDLMAAEQKSVIGEIAERNKAETEKFLSDYKAALLHNQDLDAQAAAVEKAAKEKFLSDYKLATTENQDLDAQAYAAERAARQKFLDDYKLSTLANQDLDAQANAAAKAAKEKFLNDYKLATFEDQNLDAQAAAAQKAAKEKFLSDYKLATLENQDLDAQAAAIEKAAREKFLNDYKLAVSENQSLDAQANAAAKTVKEKFLNDYKLAALQNQDLDAQATAVEKAAKEKFLNAYKLATTENQDLDAQTYAAERAVRQKFLDDYKIAALTNQDLDAQANAAAKAAKEKFLNDFKLATLEDQGLDAQAAAAQKAAKEKFLNDYKLATLENQDLDAQATAIGKAAREKFLNDYKLAVSENQSLDAQVNVAAKAAKEKFLNDHKLAVLQNQDLDAQATKIEREAREKFLSDFKLATLENQNLDVQTFAAERAAKEKYLNDHKLATRENEDLDAQIRQAERAAREKFLNDYKMAGFDNEQRSRETLARTRPMDMARGDVYGPLPYDLSIQGRPEERANANAENREYDLKKEFEEWKVKEAKSGRPFAKMSQFDLGSAAIGLQMAGDAITNKVRESILAGFDYEHLMSIVTSDMRVSAEQEKELRKQIDTATRATPGATRAEALEVFTDLKNVFGDFKEAQEELQPMLKMVTTLRMADLKHGGAGDMHQALAMARFIEDQGGAVNPETHTYDREKFDELAKRAVAIYVATQGRVAPTEMLAFQKMARTGGMLMNDEALYGLTPYFAQGFGASKLGTAIFSEVQAMLGNRMTRKTEDELGRMGMFGGTMTVVDKKGKSHEVWDPNTLLEEDLLRHNPYQWIHDVLGGQIAKTLGADQNTKEGQEAVIGELTKLAQRGTIAGLWGDVYRNYHPALKEGANIQATLMDKGGNFQDIQSHFMQTDPMAQILVFKAAENEFMVTAGEFLKGPAIELLKSLTDSLHKLTDWMAENPKTAEEFSKIVAEVGLGMKVLGGMAMAGFFLGPVVKITGAIASAAGVLVTGLGGLLSALVPFGAGGAGAAGLAGLEAGAAGLAAAASGKGALAKGVASSIMWAGPLGAVTAGTVGAFEGARMSGEDIAKHAEKGQTPMMIDQFGNPIGYYQMKTPEPQSLVGPTGTNGPTGSASDPLHVTVTNQPSGDDIARGVFTNGMRKMNRPPGGVTGTDLRMDPLGAFYGVAQ